ncbi:helix-turn-helix domain-containing protein, partial [Klebsiella aerogenes]|uniref:helix-turn-helix domain-containing protein n=1 Tax=Klebsiella aerogenes TaxID=548 RepID=UPI001131783B
MRAGELLKMARQAKGWSQLELSLSLGVSQRHVSFVESGRTRPSKELIVGWMLAVDAHPELLRAALLHAGFAAESGCGAATDSRQSFLPESVRLLLEASSPMPLVVFNGSWIMSGMNAAGKW